LHFKEELMSKYPAQIDNGTSLPLAVDNFTPVEAKVFNDARSAILAIETELGVKPGGIYSSVKNRLDTIELSIANFPAVQIGGDLGNTGAQPHVIGIRGNPISATAPNVGDALVFQGTAWVPQAISGVLGPASGDLSGTYPNLTVTKLQGNAVINTLLTINQDGYILTWVNASSQWQVKPAPVGFTAGGDLSGTPTSQTLSKLQGKTLSTTLASVGASQDGYTLTWVNGTAEWQAKPDLLDIFDPSSLPLTGWWRDYPHFVFTENWVSQPSAGNSGGKTLYHGASSPGNGALLNAYTTASFDGIYTSTNALEGTAPFTLADTLSTTKWWIAFLFKPSMINAPGDNPTADPAPWASRALAEDSGYGYWGIHLDTAGLHAFANDGAHRDVVLPCSNNVWHYAIAWFDGTHMNLEVDGVVATPTACGTMTGLLGVFRLGDSYSTAHYGGLIAECMTSNTLISAGDRQNIREYFNSRYALDLSNITNIQGKTLGASLASIGSSQDGYALTWVNGSTEWQANPIPAGFTAGGDLTGTTTNQNVVNIHGASVPIAGSLTTGNVLQVTGASVLGYAALNLAGGANYVTGSLPTTNQANQSMVGDVSGTTATSQVDKIKTKTLSASLSSIGSSQDGYALVWVNGSTEWQAKPASGLSGAFVAGGDLSGSNVSQQVVSLTGLGGIVTGPSTALKLGTGPISATGTLRVPKNFLLAARNGADSGDLNLMSLDGSNNLSINTSSVITLASNSITLQAVGNLLHYTNGDIYADGATVKFRGAAHGSSVVLDFASEANPKLTIGSAMASWTMEQADITTASATGAVTTIRAQNATGTTSTGGALVLTSGTGTSTVGSTLVQVGGVTKLSLGPTVSALTGTNSINLQANSAIKLNLDGVGGTAAFSSLSQFLWSSTTGVSTNALAFNFNDTGATSIAFSLGTIPTIKQNDNVTNSGTGAATTIQAQNATGTTSVGGDLVLTSGTGTSTNGNLIGKVGGTAKLTLAATTSDLTSTNQTNITSGSIVLKLFGGASNTAAFQGCNGIYYASTSGVSTTALNYVFVDAGVSTMSWSPTTTATMLQADTAVNGATGKVLTIQAQNATGTTSTGGNLVLKPGTGTSTNGHIELGLGTVATTGTVRVANGFSLVGVGAGAQDIPIIGIAAASNNITIGTQTTGIGVIDIDAGTGGGTRFFTNSIQAFPAASGQSIWFETMALAYTKVFDAAVTSVSISQATHATVAHPFTIQAGNTTTGTGSNLILQSGSGSVSDGDVVIKNAATTTATFKPAGLTLGAGLTVHTATATASPYTIDGYAAKDYTIFVDTTTAMTINLPAPTNGRVVIIKDSTFNAATNNITIVRNGSEKIEGVAASRILSSNGMSITLTSNGTDWFVTG
jgi:hypothetical protein